MDGLKSRLYAAAEQINELGERSIEINQTEVEKGKKHWKKNKKQKTHHQQQNNYIVITTGT